MRHSKPHVINGCGIERCLVHLENPHGENLLACRSGLGESLFPYFELDASRHLALPSQPPKGFDNILLAICKFQYRNLSCAIGVLRQQTFRACTHAASVNLSNPEYKFDELSSRKGGNVRGYAKQSVSGCVNA